MVVHFSKEKYQAPWHSGYKLHDLVTPVLGVSLWALPNIHPTTQEYGLLDIT